MFSYNSKFIYHVRKSPSKVRGHTIRPYITEVAHEEVPYYIRKMMNDESVGKVVARVNGPLADARGLWARYHCMLENNRVYVHGFGLCYLRLVFKFMYL
jgi:hypothetical protein